MREAVESEIRTLEELIGAGLETRVAERNSRLAEIAESRKRQSEEAAVKELAELQAYGEATLQKLDEELIRRRTNRLKDEAARRETRLQKEKQVEDRKRQAEEEARKRQAAAADPAQRLKVIVKRVEGHMSRGEMDAAQTLIAEGLELDAFNRDLLEIDAKIREAIANDTFTTSAAPSPDAKKGKEKEKEKEKDKGRGKHGKGKKQKSRPAQPLDAPGAGAAAPAKQGRRIPAWAVTGVAALIIGVAGVIAWIEYQPKTVQRGTVLAVLPWNSGGDSDLGVFALALPEVLARALSAGPSSMGVLGYSTTSGLAGLGGDPIASLTKLGYSHFLRGAIMRLDSAFAIRLELTDSVGGSVWSAEYKRDSTGLFLVPFEAAHGLRAYFREPIGGATAVEVKDPDAYVRYLRGLNALREPAGAGVDQAIADFSGAVSLDSTFADAWTGLASALVEKRAAAETGRADPLPDARSAAERAVSLAPGSAAGRFALTRVLIEQRNFVGALAELDSAASLSPTDSRVPYLKGMAFFRSGQVPQALDLLQQAYTLDPRNPAVLELLATAHQVNGGFDRALWFRETAMHFEGDSLRYLAGSISDLIMHDPALALGNAKRVTSACLRQLERDPYQYFTLYSLARVLQGSGDIQESITYFNGLESSLRAHVKASPGDTRARMYLGLTLTRLGRYADATAIGEAAVKADTANVEAKYLLARIYALQMYSNQTKSVDSTRSTRATELMRQALQRRFDDDQLCSADLYNLYSHGDIRSLIQ